MGTIRRNAVVLALACGALLGCTPAQGGDGAPAAEGADAAAPEATPAGAAERPAERPTTAPAAPRAGTAWVIFGADTVVAEVASTADERAQGLMYREEVPDGTGMLFVFDRADIQSFWMQNTYVPLDIAYMDAGFTVVDIQQMEPLTTDAHPSAAPAMFALEVRQGWFEEHGVRVGQTAQIVFGVVGG